MDDATTAVVAEEVLAAAIEGAAALVVEVAIEPDRALWFWFARSDLDDCCYCDGCGVVAGGDYGCYCCHCCCL